MKKQLKKFTNLIPVMIFSIFLTCCGKTLEIGATFALAAEFCIE